MIPGFGATIRRTSGLSALATPTVRSPTSEPRRTAGDPHVLRRWPCLVVAGVAGQHDAHAVALGGDAGQHRFRAPGVGGGIEQVVGALEAADGLEALDRRED